MKVFILSFVVAAFVVICESRAHFRPVDPKCELPIEEGPCLALSPRWGFDVKKGKCVPFIYGGCRGNANKFPSKEKCVDKCFGKDIHDHRKINIVILDKI
ncbi:trypsin inhibitor-like [Anticarsia gemmatalis]|uniref:trypsin inhibitor-like n=1 Tax=Anticarsia gemmatalis TaxID=129554 RepID=UPI003F765A89